MSGPVRHGPCAGRLRLAIALLVSVCCCAPVPAEEAPAFDITQPKQRLAAPDIRLADLAGLPVALERYRGKLVLAHFWATFCAPCRDEMPALERLWQRYRDDGLVVVAIAADRGNIDVVREFARQTAITFPVLHDAAGTVRDRYEVTALPMTYVIGRDGKISGRAIGTRDWSGAQGRAYIESRLESGR